MMVSRTSNWGDDQPCNEAFKEKYTRIDQRTFKTPAEHDARLRIPWESEGANHRINKAGIARDFEDEGWFVNIESLDELIKLQEKYGRLVLCNSWQNPDILEIEIYDTYRE